MISPGDMEEWQLIELVNKRGYIIDKLQREIRDLHGDYEAVTEALEEHLADFIPDGESMESAEGAVYAEGIKRVGEFTKKWQAVAECIQETITEDNGFCPICGFYAKEGPHLPSCPAPAALAAVRPDIEERNQTNAE